MNQQIPILVGRCFEGRFPYIVTHGDNIYKIHHVQSECILDIELDKLLRNWKRAGINEIFFMFYHNIRDTLPYNFIKREIFNRGFKIYGESEIIDCNEIVRPFYTPTDTDIRDITPIGTGQILDETPITYKPISFYPPLAPTGAPTGTGRIRQEYYIPPSVMGGGWNWLVIAGLVIGGILLFMFLNKKKG